ncbi:MAG: thermonuclease family protein [Chloroflexi bacterium]|nr:thermonuclease family protein [Chloroflexota bacterium]
MNRALAVVLCLLTCSVLACATEDGGAREPRGTASASASASPASPLTATATRAAAVPTESPTTAGAASTAVPAPPGEHATVTRVVDGDTIEVQLDGTIERVRFILVDTPEVYGGVECFGREASAFTAGLLPVGIAVWLERDVSERDRYRRLLRYVYLADGQMVNELILAEGFASVATYPPDLKHLDRLRAAEAVARDLQRGLWTTCSDDLPATPVAPTAAATAAARTISGTPSTAACDASYPDVCIPVGAADYDCAGGSGNGPNYISGPIRVLPPDPHRLDRDHDGWGCE